MLNTHNLTESGQNRLEWLKILEMLWSVMRLIFKTSSVTPDFFYVFRLILSLSFAVKVSKKSVRGEFWARTSLRLKLSRSKLYFSFRAEQLAENNYELELLMQSALFSLSFSFLARRGHFFA